MISIADIKYKFKYYLRWHPYRFRFYGIIILFVAVLSLSVCSIHKEPEVWDLRGKIVNLTTHLQGIPYKYGGYDIEGFDCSGLVYYVYDSFGITVPRSTKKQAKLKEKVSLKKAKPADILVFKLRRQLHTAIYTGNNSFIHAPNRRGVVRKESLTNFWRKNLRSVISLIDE